MENSEQIPGNEANKNFQKGSIRPNPTRNNRTNLGGNSPGGHSSDPDENNKQAAEFDPANAETEINPGQLDREEINLDRTGVDDSPDHSLHNFKSQMDDVEEEDGGGTEQSLSDDPNRSGRSPEQSKRHSTGEVKPTQGQRNGVGGGNDAKIKEAQKENLLGQGGYGTSGTSGTNSEPNQGNQSGPSSAGSPNGSTGYNAGLPGARSRVKDPNKNGDANHRP